MEKEEKRLSARSAPVPEQTDKGPPGVGVRSYRMPRRKRNQWVRTFRTESRHDAALAAGIRAGRTAGGQGSSAQALSLKIRRKAIRLIFTAAALAGIVILIPLVKLTSSLFTVKTLTLEGETRYSAEEIASYAGIRTGGSLWKAAFSADREAAMENCPYLCRLDVDADLDGSVVLRVEEYAPDVYFELAGRYYAVTADLFVVECREDAAAFSEAGLVPAEMPGIAVAVQGERLRLSADDGEYITAFLTAASDLGTLDGFSGLSLGNRYAIEATDRNGILIRYGSVTDIRSKLVVAERLTAEPAQNAPDCEIDVSVPGAAVRRKRRA